MTKEQAEDIVFDLNNKCITLSVSESEKIIVTEGFPGLAKIYTKYCNGGLDVRDYLREATQHLQVSDTKLYKVMK